MTWANRPLWGYSDEFSWVTRDTGEGPEGTNEERLANMQAVNLWRRCIRIPVHRITHTYFESPPPPSSSNCCLATVPSSVSCGSEMNTVHFRHTPVAPPFGHGLAITVTSLPPEQRPVPRR